MPKPKGRAGRSSRERKARERQQAYIGRKNAERREHARSIPQAQPGARNAYQCAQCHGYVVTVHRDAGTTPFRINCVATEGCDGSMLSNMYRPFSLELGPPTYEWVLPTPKQYARLSPYMRQHVDQGGVLLRPITESETADASRP